MWIGIVFKKWLFGIWYVYCLCCVYVCVWLGCFFDWMVECVQCFECFIGCIGFEQQFVIVVVLGVIVEYMWCVDGLLYVEVEIDDVCDQ